MRTTTKFRQLLDEPGIIQAPGAYDCLTAKIIEIAGSPRLHEQVLTIDVGRIA